MKDYMDDESRSFVVVCGERVPTDEVEFLNVEEDLQGRDVMTFNYNGQEHTSLVFVTR